MSAQENQGQFALLELGGPAPAAEPTAGAEDLAEVAVARPLRQTYTYRVPEKLAGALTPGIRLVVPFGTGRAIGIYLGPAASAPPSGTKAILEVLDTQAVFTPDLLDLIRWAAEYYRHPLGEALKGALPPGLTEMRSQPVPRSTHLQWVERVNSPDLAEPRGALMRAVLSYLEACGRTEMGELSSAVPGAPDAARRLAARGWVRITEQVLEGDGVGSALSSPVPDRLTQEQVMAVSALTRAIDASEFSPFLLHGVTGSGKTEVYLQAIARVLELGRGALCLVPEIGLTPQLVGRFRGRFGDAVAVLHSGLRDAQRLAEWRRLRDGTARVAVGVRSAIFAPVAELGLIVVDEEHDPSFKQEDYLRYHARDLAVMRARQRRCPVVLGSATPSLETLTNARSGRYGLLPLTRRIDDRPLPRVEIVDLRLREPAAEGTGVAANPVLSSGLSAALASVLDRGEQAILFLNRRGHSTFVTCSVCGFTVRCPNCAISLTHHLARRGLLCHYCNYSQGLPRHCPECRGELLRLGLGTEKVAEEVARAFPGARILRLDRDSAGDAAELTHALSRFARGHANVMIGTQMVAKGHDFPGVTLVGVILADTALAIPDFRAAERTFQVLAQVAGRAGRGEQPGRVVVQTFNPDSDAVAKVVGHDFEAFSASELRRREALGFPPYSRLVAIRLDGLHERRTWDFAQELGRVAERCVRAQRLPVRVLGPAPAPIPRLRGRSRFQLMLKGPTRSLLEPVVNAVGAMSEPAPAGVRVAFDVDPVSML